ncbi:MAG: alpha/beta hydrolase [Acholeplasmataceae bacterium]|nr:alpha/beta hydrolase [Acholeplasmataceae bacterium]
MKHVFKQGTNGKTIVLLHGTGGNEHDLIEIGYFIDPDANLLGIRGNVLENGLPRFFKRLSFGVFDEDNLIEETHRLHEFIDESITKYKLDPEKISAIGYSNGANILASLLLFHPNTIQKAMCLHAMVPIKNIEVNKHLNTKALLTLGLEDQIVNPKEAYELKEMLEIRNIKVDLFETPYGHQITKMELDYLKKWYDKN